MLVPRMNPCEIRAEIDRDWPGVIRSTARLMYEYDKERKRGRIPKSAVYPRAYPIRSHSKNYWVLIFSKAPSARSFKDITHSNVVMFTYYYSDKGLRVFRVRDYSDSLYVYNGHLFSRYRERMKLDMKHPLDTVNHFFSYNDFSIGTYMEKDGSPYLLSFCHDGILLGKTEQESDWIIYNTFVSRDLFFSKQENMVEDMVRQLKGKLMQAVESKDPEAIHLMEILMSVTRSGLIN